MTNEKLDRVDSIARIGPPGETQIFSLDEARALLPLISKITATAVGELEPVQKRLRRSLSCDPRLPAIESRYEQIVRRWIGKVERLGLSARGLWWVDFDTGEGFLCWRFPEIRLDYFHDYGEKPAERRRIDDLFEQYRPDWMI